MRRNCNLELCLLPSGDRKMEERSKSRENQQRQLTIFYNGKVCVCDVTDQQARAILMIANRIRDETAKTPTGSEPSSPPLKSRLNIPNGTVSMKRSLQRFLQKRKSRIQAASPY